jgi:hypothetical protein
MGVLGGYFQIMDSDDSNISDHVGDLDIQPYQFEPLCNDESQEEREHSTSEDSDIDESCQKVRFCLFVEIIRKKTTCLNEKL